MPRRLVTLRASVPWSERLAFAAPAIDTAVECRNLVDLRFPDGRSLRVGMQQPPNRTAHARAEGLAIADDECVTVIDAKDVPLGTEVWTVDR